MKNISKLAILLISIFISSCSDDDTSAPVIPDGDYFDGILVLNEGGFSGGASVSFIPNDLNQIHDFIFENSNPGKGVGVIAQSIFFEDDKAYVISNQSNIISVVNRYTFELLGKIDSGLNKPRYGVVLNDKAYVTNQADFSTDQDDFVAVINLNDFEVEESISTNGVAEHIVESNGQIFIQNAAFGFGNRLSKFDPATNTITQVLELDTQLNSLQVHKDIIYALDSSGVKVIDPDSFSVQTEITTSEMEASFSNLRVYNDELYYTLGTKAYSSSITADELSTEAIFDYGIESDFGSFYGFGVNEDRIFVGDAGDFSTNGRIFIYSTSGELLFDDSVGSIGPNSFYFQ